MVILIIHLVEYWKYGTEHDKIDGLLNGISLVHEYGNVLGSADIFIDGELKIRKVDFRIYVI